MKGTFIFLLYLGITFAQTEYGGLLFSNNKVPVANKTTLDLTNHIPVTAEKEFTLNFDFSFWDTKAYGPLLYIKDKNYLIEIKHVQYLNEDTSYFFVLYNQKILLNKIAFPKNQLTKNRWYQFQITVNSNKNIITSGIKNYNNSNYSVRIPSKFNFEIISGLNHLLDNTDVPKIALRNAKVTSGKTVLRSWLMNEAYGYKLFDSVDNNRFGVFTNAELLTKHHFNLEKIADIYTSEINKLDHTSFNPIKNEIYLSTIDSQFIINTQKYSIERKKFTFPKPSTVTLSFYNPISNQIISYHDGLGSVSTYNFSSNSWSYIDTIPDWQRQKLNYNHASLYNPKTNELIAIGGYGWFKAKNGFYKYNFNKNVWSELKPKGDRYFPRYTNAGGYGPDSNFIYVFGGEGNESDSGHQNLGYHEINDLVEYDIKNNKLRVVYTLKDLIVGGALCRRLQYIKEDDSFIGMLYLENPNSTGKHDNIKWMKLFKIFRTEPKFEIISTFSGNDYSAVPSELYYDKDNQELIFITTTKFNEIEKPNTRIFKMAYPPIKRIEPIPEEENAFALNKWFYFSATALLIIGIFIFIKLRNKKASQKENETSLLKPLSLEVKYIQEKSYKINLFGNFKILNDLDEDTTQLLPSKAKQLFLLILLHTAPTHKKTNGISSEELSLILWPDADQNQAKNNRNASISRLRGLLSKVNYLEIIYDDLWKMSFKENNICDYHIYLEIRKRIKRKEVTLAEIETLISILNKGVFLKDSSFEWLDDLQKRVFDEVIMVCESLLELEFVKKSITSVLNICNVILIWDSLNIKAMRSKCRSLNQMDKIVDMKIYFEGFCKEYKEVSGQNFKPTLEEIIEN